MLYHQQLLFGARLNRLTYLAAHGVAGAMGRASNWLYDAGWTFASAGLSTIVMAGLIIISGRRLHDLGRSAWWQLPINGPLLVLCATSPFVSEQGAKAVVGWIPPQALLAWLGCAILFVLGLILVPGQKGENRYGLAPRRTFGP